MKAFNIDVKKLLLEIKQETGMNQSQIAEAIGTGRSYLSDISGGRVPLTQDLRDKLLSLLPADKCRIDDLPEDASGIPVIPTDAIAGYGKLSFEDLPVEDYYKVGCFQSVDFLIRVAGDSMSPKYCGGDLVACRMVNDLRFFQWGRIYVIDTRSQGIVIKRVQRSPNESAVTCVSENPKYDDFDVEVDDISHIALVVGAITLD